MSQGKIISSSYDWLITIMDLASGDATMVSVYIALHMASTLGFFIIVLTAAFSSRVMRHPTWFSFCLSWATWSLSFSLLFYAGQQTQLTSRTLCIVQSALAYTMPFLWVLMTRSIATCPSPELDNIAQRRSNHYCPCYLCAFLRLVRHGTDGSWHWVA